MWEYNRIVIKFKLIKDLLNELNGLGADNWEIISYEEIRPKKFNDDYESIILLKRKKIPIQ